MKILKLIYSFLVFIPAFIHCQSTDTLIVKVDELFKVEIVETLGNGEQIINYWTKSKKMLNLNKEMLYLKGIQLDEELGYIDRLDSVKIVNENGQIEEEKYFGKKNSSIKYVYNGQGVSRYTITVKEKSGMMFYFFASEINEEKLSSVKQNFNLIGINKKKFLKLGKNGEVQGEVLNLKNEYDNPVKLSFRSNDSSIVFKQSNILCHANSFETLQFELAFNGEDVETNIEIFKGDTMLYSIPVTLEYYDLNEEDFNSLDRLDVSPIVNINALNLKIALNTDEKLLHIFRKGLRVHTQAISKVVNEVDFSVLESGEYLIEILDLGKNESKYCRVILSKGLK